MRTRADSTGPNGEKIWSSVAELVVPGILPIHSARVGMEEISVPCSGDPPVFMGGFVTVGGRGGTGGMVEAGVMAPLAPLALLGYTLAD